jgi:signal transduction histidine kinase
MTLYASLKPSDKKEVDIKKLINNTLVIFEEELKDRNIEVKKEYNGELNLLADENQMTTVINNLLLNAIDASGNNSKIEIIADEKKDYINLKIKDYGDGIPEEILPKVFIPFFTTKSKGSGLGLSIVNRIIQNHYGVIKADNWENGACFSIKMPKGF